MSAHDPEDDATTKRSLDRENQVAKILADHGYRIHQNPALDEVAEIRRVTGDMGRARSEPDYALEGRIFDCYSPEPETNVRNVWTAVKRKITTEQTQRVIVDLEGWRGDVRALQRQFDEWPIENLKEVKAVLSDGHIIQIDLPPAQG